MEALDKIDKQLLKLLGENSNVTVKDLATAVKLSATPVFERVKRLEANG